MEKKPIISIVTPFFNAEEYIEETAKSVLGQTFTNFEWIIVDDNSNLKAKEKLEEIKRLDDRIKVFYAKDILKEDVSAGPAVARDIGIAKSSIYSKYIVFLDADDLYDKTFLECAYWTLETHPEASWTYTDSINFGARNFLWRKYYNPRWEAQENILVVSACIRKKDLIEVGCFGLKEKKVYEDWYLWLKLIKLGKYPVRMNSLLTYYRQKEGTSELKTSNSENRKRALKLIKQAKRDLYYAKDGIQFPKYDYYWENIKDKMELGYTENSKKDNGKVNILMIIPWMITGGADKFNLNLIERLNRNKFEFTVITTLPATNEWRKYFEKYACVYDLTTFLKMEHWVSFINYIIEKNNINLIFNSNSEFGYKILPYLKAKHPTIPIVDYVHMEELYWKNGGYSRDSSVNESVIDKTFTCNENSRKIFIDKFKRKENEIETIYIGVDEKRFDPNKYDKKQVLEEIENLTNKKIGNKKVISYICRMVEQKRPYLFFEVIKELKRRRDDFVVIVAGDGHMLNNLKAKVKNAKLDNYFIFLGNFKETEKIYRISDLTLNTSIKEGVALTSYESLAMNVPVVSSNVGGQAELITSDVGVIVPCMQKEDEILDFNYSKEEIESYILAINKVLSNFKFYKNNCRNRILNRFTIDKMIEKIGNEFINIKENPNKEKIEKGMELSKNMIVLKELISTYLVSSKTEYEWLADNFNKNNIHQIDIKKVKSFKPYEHTLEYKIKHPFVVGLKKIGMYKKLKRILDLRFL